MQVLAQGRLCFKLVSATARHVNHLVLWMDIRSHDSVNLFNSKLKTLNNERGILFQKQPNRKKWPDLFNRDRVFEFRFSTLRLTSMRVITVNVNGIRAARRKGFFEWLKAQKTDFVCLQEPRAQTVQLENRTFWPDSYH